MDIHRSHVIHGELSTSDGRQSQLGASCRRHLRRLGHVHAVNETRPAEEQGHDRQPAVQRTPGVLETLSDLEYEVERVLASAHALGYIGP